MIFPCRSHKEKIKSLPRWHTEIRSCWDGRLHGLHGCQGFIRASEECTDPEVIHTQLHQHHLTIYLD